MKFREYASVTSKAIKGDTPMEINTTEVHTDTRPSSYYAAAACHFRNANCSLIVLLFDVAKPDENLGSSSRYSNNYSTKVRKLAEERINKYLGVLKALALNFSSVGNTFSPLLTYSQLLAFLLHIRLYVEYTSEPTSLIPHNLNTEKAASHNISW
jgi:hypothetical protein